MTSRQLADGDYEGYGIAVIEAALCGKAAVVSDNSGLAEAVDDGQTGLLVKQNDSEAVAEAICRLIEDPQELNTLSKNALSKASKQTWSKISAVYLDIFAEIIKRVES
jgi:glycosyltransferase involved in cell wall biosynthesis